MFKIIILIFILFVAGCASDGVQEPLAMEPKPVALLNAPAFKQIKEGMTPVEVHGLMGQELIIGYSATGAGTYKPLTIPNPYKFEQIQTPQGEYVVEYYVSTVLKADGIVSEDEMMPLIFKDGKLIGRGWPRLNSLRTKKPSA